MTPKATRCAVYTRKSTEHNLELEFNSLDAQREACEAYIKSQAHEGWRLIPDYFDDGGISGASLERPALQRLLDDVRAGRVDTVVVYKVDRLTRSLTDFAKLVELFDQHSVSFVSITQSFNTTTSMGRLTLNVLLSFAQFEREVIGERVRDKIAASKRKGLWMGGPPPLGYEAVNKKLTIVEPEAETVRYIFKRYLELGSVHLLAEDLARKSILTKKRDYAGGRTVGGADFRPGALAYLLKNRVYVGEVVHRREKFAGDHVAIIDAATFEAVQENLKTNANERHLQTARSGAILAGRIFDAAGNRLTPTHTNKNGVRYRYYLGPSIRGGKRLRVPAPEVETMVCRALRTHINGLLNTAPVDDAELVSPNLERVVVTASALEIHMMDEGSEPLVLSWSSSTKKAAVQCHASENTGQAGGRESEAREDFLRAVGRARVWLQELLAGECIEVIAQREGWTVRHVRSLTRLAFVSPRFAEAIASESSADEPNITELAVSLSHSWLMQDEKVRP